jgi:GNAT superfamily N-acetyltransferase
MKQIKPISASETVIVRHPVLRKGMPIATCKFNGDENSTTVHFGFFEANQIVGVVSLFAVKNEVFETELQFQIRGMAVIENQQKKGIGKALILHSESFATQQKTELIWFNAREHAVPFYIKMGYKITGAPFEIDAIGTHYLMYKRC